MALDPNVVCPACKRFWHGPPGRLALNAPYCEDPRHAMPAPMERVRPRDLLDVRLSPLEMAIAGFVAEQRNRDGVRAHADEQKHGFDGPSNLDLHRAGCLGEMAFAKGVDRYWSGAGVGYYDDDDVGEIQIRTTAHPHGCLLMRPSEGALDKPWALVIGEGAIYRLSGWLWGHEGRQERWLRSPNSRPPAYFIPQSELRPFIKERA